MNRHGGLAVAAIAIGLLLGLPGVGVAQTEPHPTVVSEDPADHTPQLAADDSGEKPRVLAVAHAGGTVYAGGMFHNVADSSGQNVVARSNLFAFDAATGALHAFAPQVDGAVWAVVADGESVYVGGDFTTVNGVARRGLAKLDAQTGTVDAAFEPPFGTGRVTDLELVGGRLLVAGSFPRRLVALRPDDGRGTSYVAASIAGRVPGTNETTNVFRFAVDASQTHLVAVGNFTSVDGVERVRAFMLDLGPSQASLNPWWYPPFARSCASTKPALQSYLQDVDFAPDGSYFVVVSTGYVVSSFHDLGTMVCDAAARFETAEPSPSAPTWINYTGGDTLHSVAATGAAVYVQGHNRWLNNPYGRDSAGPGAVARKGGGALDPSTGMALDWNPVMPNQIGGYAFLATADGLWIGRDGERIGGETHRGLAFMPLP